MKRYLIIIFTLMILLLPVTNASAFVEPNYAYVVVLDLDRMVIWRLMFLSDTFTYVDDTNGDGKNDVFEADGGMAWLPDGTMGDGYISVDLDGGEIYLITIVLPNGSIYEYTSGIQLLFDFGGDKYVFAGYYPYGVFFPSAVIMGYVLIPDPVLGP